MCEGVNAENNVIEELDENSIDTLRADLQEGSFGSEDIGGDTVDDDVLNDFLSQFGAEGDTPLKAHDWKVYMPTGITENKDFWGPLFGIVRKETETIYVFDSKRFENDKYLIGYIDNGSFVSKKPKSNFEYASTCVLKGAYVDGSLALTYNEDKDFSWLDDEEDDNDNSDSSYSVRIKPYDTVNRLFSRNTGLLESSDMLDKRAVLVGCGSVGSFVAMELARSGVGKFVLCDTDTLEIHNICRHQCGFDDLGRYKVDAVKDKILNINPNAEVITYRSVIQRVPREDLDKLLDRNTIIIGGGDNRASADYACKLATSHDCSFIATGCWTRAFAGEIFYWASGRGLACYNCALGGLIDSDRPESHANYFGTDEEQESLAFEPGIATDIDFVTIIAIKLALDLINRDNPNYTPRVINYLKQYTWICNTNSEKIGGERAGIFTHPLQITTSLKVHKDENCPHCGEHHDE